MQSLCRVNFFKSRLIFQNKEIIKLVRTSKKLPYKCTNFLLIFKVDLSDSENEFEEDGVVAVPEGGGTGKTDPTAEQGGLVG